MFQDSRLLPDSAKSLSSCEPHSLLCTFSRSGPVGHDRRKVTCTKALVALCGGFVSRLTLQALRYHIDLLLGQIDLRYRRLKQLSNLGQGTDGGEVAPVHTVQAALVIFVP